MRQITLKQFYDEKRKEPTPAQLLIRQIAILTERSELTVRLWLSGHHTPEPMIQRIIAKEFDLDPDTLFPEK